MTGLWIRLIDTRRVQHYQLRSNADQAEQIDHENQERQMGEKAVERRMSAVPIDSADDQGPPFSTVPQRHEHQ